MEQVPLSRPEPVASLGLLGYFAVSGRTRLRLLLNLTVAIMFCATVWFVYVLAFIQPQYCRCCLLSAATTVFICGLLLSTTPPPRE